MGKPIFCPPSPFGPYADEPTEFILTPEEREPFEMLAALKRGQALLRARRLNEGEDE